MPALIVPSKTPTNSCPHLKGVGVSGPFDTPLNLLIKLLPSNPVLARIHNPIDDIMRSLFANLKTAGVVMLSPSSDVCVKPLPEPSKSLVIFENPKQPF
jgi:hypothetical protein